MSSETQEGFDTPPCSPSGKRAKVAADDLHATFQAIFEDDDTPDYGSVPLSQTDNWQPISKPISKRLSLAADGGNLAQAKTIHDRIHGQIFMESVLVAIIDTPEFQRLRDLKQLGGTVYVYPSACHARFEHCLGVSHLAGLTVDHLIKTDNQNLNISERDRICVKIAGLCHDLGHGPFSHTFEHFVNSVRRKEGKAVWEHEAMSLNLLDHLLEKNNIDLSEYGLELPADLNFIKLLISGLGVEHSWPNNTARSERYRFLTDIVANKRNGLDVDKFGKQK